MKAILLNGFLFRQTTILTPQDLPISLPEVVENGESFAENALLKALSGAEASGLPCLADDSGLCADFLEGQPGIASARWAGPTDSDRNLALIERLKGIPSAQRGAHYFCSVCLAWPDRRLVEASGICAGVLLSEEIGAGGFGYDPLFFLPERGMTMAQLSEKEKNSFSHRAIAIANLEAKVASLRGTLPA